MEAAFAALDAFVGPAGRLDAVFSAAGISGRRYGDGPVDAATLEGWETVLAANATTQFLVARAAIRRMLAQAPDADGIRGALLLMSSTLATSPAPAHFATHAYAASKGAIDALTRSLAAHYAPSGIRVNAVAPGAGRDADEPARPGGPAILAYLAPASRSPAGRSPPSGHGHRAPPPVPGRGMVTGQVVAVDGGWTVSDADPGRARQ